MHTFGWEKGAPGTWCTYSISIESDADHGILILHKRDLYLQFPEFRSYVTVAPPPNSMHPCMYT